ncbi:ATP-binding protein [Caldimonas tepidiphila]|uniref:ATP-binding protein n=1 Tax=Caldimonas tepidiphila TaxID=2315841 RepID=UPI000E5B85FF|nr:ATP-binding protein [Caldimonas tepidiphila]
MSGPPVDLASCAREPIRIPGAIQPHGVLLGLDPASLAVVQASENLAALCGTGALPLGQRIGTALGGEPGAALEQALRALLDRLPLGTTPHHLGRWAFGGRPHDVLAHRHDGLLLLELEPVDEPGTEGFRDLYVVVRQFVTALKEAGTLEALCECAVREMQRISGFGRTLLYRFDDEGHGEVLAEACAPGYASYAGHRFPASDIPAQARELYLANPMRLIASADYLPARLVPADNPLTGRPTDLSHAVLRSVSPVHLEYMRNMGTLASMSVSLIVRGRLWGLISCHDHAPRHLPHALRAACEHLGEIVSLQIEAHEDRAQAARRLELRGLVVSLLAALADTDGSLEHLADAPRELLRFGSAGGAAIVLDERCVLVGDTPSQPQVLALADWLLAQGEEVFATDRLAELHPAAADCVAQASGVLSLSLSQVHRHLVIWFRPEVRRTIDWAGDPRKPVQPEHHGRLHPRLSFATWHEEVRERSLPWLATERDATEELRHALLRIVLKRAEEMAQMAGELGRINKELESFSYSVSHDLRAPLRHIAGYSDMLLELQAAHPDERASRYLQHIQDAARFAGLLVDGLLSFSKMGRASLRRSMVDLDLVVATIVRELRRESASRAIRWEIERLPTVWADPVLMELALRNLLANAEKYTAGRDPAVVRVHAEEDAQFHRILVSDNGIGFNMKYAGKLFGVFQRLHSSEQFEGTGIGLANVRRVVERHGGSVSAHGEPGQGATFSFTLPKFHGPAAAP